MANIFSDIFGGGAEADAAAKDKAAAALYQGQATNALDTTYATGTDALNKGISSYTPLSNLATQYSAATPVQLGALGIGSPDQVAAAQKDFTAGPGYQFQMDQGLQALARQHAAAGNPASGNADIDAITYGQGVANQAYYNNWLPAVANAANTGVSATGAAASGQAAGYGSLASLASNYGQNTANVYGNVESNTVAANNLQAAGEAAGAKNLLSAGMQVAKGATALLPV